MKTDKITQTQSFGMSLHTSRWFSTDQGLKRNIINDPAIRPVLNAKTKDIVAVFRLFADEVSCKVFKKTKLYDC